MLEAVLTTDRLSDLAKATNMSPSTAHRVLNELVSTGWVSQDEDKRYLPGRHLHSIAGLLREDGEIGRAARPSLEALRRDTGMTVHFGLVKGDSVMYADKLDGLGAYRMKSRVGGIVPLYCTSIGKSYLASLPDERVVEIVKRSGMERITEHTLTTVGALVDELRTTRRRGWALDDGENEPNLRCVGAAVFDASGRAIGGASVSALAFELPPDRLPEVSTVVRRAASQISRALGYTGDAA